MNKIILKRIIGSASLAAALIAGTNLGWTEAKKSAKKAAAEGSAYVIDAQKSEVRWIGRKVTGQHNGTLKIKGGQIMVTGGAVTGGNVVFDMNSITVLDLTDSGSNAKLTGHLKSDDFFGSAKFPTAEFKIGSVTPLASVSQGGPSHSITGTLTIKGASHPLAFDALITLDGKSARAKAWNVKVDRTLYNIRYGSGKFFQNLGDKAIDDTFSIDLDVAANQKR